MLNAYSTCIRLDHLNKVKIEINIVPLLNYLKVHKNSLCYFPVLLTMKVICIAEISTITILMHVLSVSLHIRSAFFCSLRSIRRILLQTFYNFSSFLKFLICLGDVCVFCSVTGSFNSTII